jgi:hypothetical protein
MDTREFLAGGWQHKPTYHDQQLAVATKTHASFRRLPATAPFFNLGGHGRCPLLVHNIYSIVHLLLLAVTAQLIILLPCCRYSLLIIISLSLFAAGLCTACSSTRT